MAPGAPGVVNLPAAKFVAYARIAWMNRAPDKMYVWLDTRIYHDDGRYLQYAGGWFGGRLGVMFLLRESVLIAGAGCEPRCERGCGVPNLGGRDVEDRVRAVPQRQGVGSAGGAPARLW